MADFLDEKLEKRAERRLGLDSETKNSVDRQLDGMGRTVVLYDNEPKVPFRLLPNYGNFDVSRDGEKVDDDFEGLRSGCSDRLTLTYEAT